MVDHSILDERRNHINHRIITRNTETAFFCKNKKLEFILNHRLYDRQYIVYNQYIANELFEFFQLIFLSIVNMMDALNERIKFAVKFE
jgi:hypothetical protein